MDRRSFVASLGAAAASAAPVTSTAVQLGYPSDLKLLMVHADDAGMCHSVNLATMEALASGGVHSASAMVPCPWFGEFAEWSAKNPAMDVGLHLTLQSEWRHYRWPPVAPAEKVKGLIDPAGYIWRDVRSTATNASAQEVEIELRAQIERARRAGVKFTHFDTHMGTLYARPDYFDVYTKLAREAGVPCMLLRPENTTAEQRAYPITAEMLSKKIFAGFVPVDYLVTGVPGRSVEERRASYRAFLAGLRPGVTKLIVHLAKDDPEIRAVTNNWEQRWADFQFWTSAEAGSLMKQHGIRGITYRELGRIAYR